MKSKKTTQAQLKKLQRKQERKNYIEWSKLVKERDDYKCAICEAEGLLHTHHIIPRQNKMYRFDVDNGITLCPRHHKYSFIISAHKNPLVFFMWFERNRSTQFLRLKHKHIDLFQRTDEWYNEKLEGSSK